MSITTAVLGGLTSLGSAIYGAISSSRRNKQAKDLIAAQRKENKDWYNTKMSEDYTKRSDVQSALQRQRAMLNDRYRTEKAAQAVSGGTDEAMALEKQADADAMSKTYSNIAANAANYRDQVEQQYRAQDAALNQQQAATLQAQAQATAQAASQGVNAGIGLLGAGFNEMEAKKLRETKYVPHNKRLDEEENS